MATNLLGRQRSLFLRRAFFTAMFATAILPCFSGPSADAAVVATGNVTPAPPAGGGNVSGPFFVGDATLGTLAIDAGTALTVTSNSMTVGDDLDSIGAVSMTGFGSNLTINSDLLLANRGVGTFIVRSQAFLTTSDDLEVGVISGSNGTLIVENLGSILDVGDDAIIGSGGSGAVELLGGGRAVADVTTIGRVGGSSGRLTIDGPNSQWRQIGIITVGESGQGRVQITNQGQLITGAAEIGKTGTAAGTVSVSGLGSAWSTAGTFTVGVGALGVLDILDGARVSNSAATRIGQGSLGDGRVQVSGAGSTWVTGTQFVIGDSGDGALRIVDGGRVTSAGATLGAAASARGEVTVDGLGSTWDMTTQGGQLLIGNSGRGYLTIANEGLVVTNSSVTVGTLGELRLAGGRLQLGENLMTNQGLIRGSGRIDGVITNSLSGEVRVQAHETLSIGTRLTNNGAVNVDGGELELGQRGGQSLTSANNLKIAVRDGVLRLVGAGLENNTGAQLAITGGDVDVFGTINNKSGAQIVIGGGATAVFHDTVTNNGQLHVFPGADVLMLKNLSFGASSLLGMQLGATDLTDAMGQMEVTGQAALAGTLNVELAGGFAPTLGNSFSLLTASNGMSGAFSTANLPALGGGLAWDLDYSANSVLLSVVAGGGGPSADFDADGDVDAADLAKWKTGFGKASGALLSDGDANGDGVVNGSDFMIWQRQLGTTPSGPVAGAVPEPTGGALLASALVVAAIGWRRRAPKGSRASWALALQVA